jgi:hypothetical protein
MAELLRSYRGDDFRVGPSVAVVAGPEEQKMLASGSVNAGVLYPLDEGGLAADRSEVQRYVRE